MNITENVMPPQKSRIKRLPQHSYTIIMKFASDKERNDCIKSSNFEEIYGKMISLLRTYNCRIENIMWDVIKGKREENRSSN